MMWLYDFGYRWGWRATASFCRKVLRVDIGSVPVEHGGPHA